MKRYLLYALAGLLAFSLWPTSLMSAPAISDTTGTLDHGGTLVITGTDFGSKSPAAPLKWDDCEDKTPNSYEAVAAEYSQVNPGSYSGTPDAWKIQYRNSPFTNVSTPVTAVHDNSTRYLCGGHYEDDVGSHQARDVQVTVPTADGSASERWFVTFYYTIDPSWPACGNSPNHKMTTMQSGHQAYSNSPYTNQYFYMDFSLHPCNDYGYVGIKSHGDMSSSWCNVWYQNPTACNSGTVLGDGAQYRGNTPTEGNWIRLEQHVSNDQGFLTFLIDNHTVWSGTGRVDWVPTYTAVDSGIRSFSVGGYYREYLYGAGFQNNDAFRYFDDIYIDNTLSRVMLGDAATYTACTILEPQIPTAWSATEITVTVNRGQITGTSYLYIFDADNSASPGHSVDVLFESTYYVANDGNNSNTGLSDAQAWQTILGASGVNSKTLIAGDTVLFQRGDEFRGGLEGAETGVTYGAYGTGAPPLILGSVDRSSPGNWTDLGSNIWRTSGFNDEVGNLIFDNENSVGTWVATSVALTEQDEFWYDSTNDQVRMYSTNNPGDRYSVIEVALETPCISLTDANSDIVIENLDLRYSAGFGIYANEGADNIVIRDNLISYIGGDTGNITRLGNGIEFWDGVTELWIYRNVIDNCYDSAITTQGNGIYSVDSVFIYNNIISNCEYCLVPWIRDEQSTFSNVYYENNTCQTMGGGWGHDQRPSAQQGSCFMFFTSTGITSNVYLRNNICDGATEYMVRVWNTDNFDDFNVDSNLYYSSTGAIARVGPTYYAYPGGFAGWQTRSGWDTNSVLGDPLLDSSFVPAAGSPAIDAGVTTPNVTTDFIGTSRPTGAGYDIGAYEVLCGAAGDCDDSNACTDDACTAGSCSNTNNTDACDDSVFCNGDDACSGGSCVSAGDPCTGGGECNVVCNEATDDCYDAVGTVCTSDENACTDNACDGAGACAATNNTDACDDGTYCNGADTCSGGSCGNAGDPCSGGAACNTNCNEAAETCYNAAEASCTTDADACTTDWCDGAGTCVHPITKDTDTDGYIDDNCSGGDDCDDTDIDINPGATEVCDSADNNCDGDTDEGVEIKFYQDDDGDTYGNIAVTSDACTAPGGYVSNQTDCDDTDGNINPGATEGPPGDATCSDAADNDCNGATDSLDVDCQLVTPNLVIPPWQLRLFREFQRQSNELE